MGRSFSFDIGLIHGVGAETPTQVAALAALVGIVGIFFSNLAVGLLTALFSLIVGVLFVIG